MKRNKTLFLVAQLAWALALSVPLHAQAANVCEIQEGGSGGTGISADTGGMGGTGNNSEGGIGGTGAVAQEGGTGGTGIVGTVTGFASICVNGTEVHYDTNTPVTENGTTVNTKRLAIGQVVTVEARLVGRELKANAIAILDAVVGPISRVDAASNQLQVLGQTVRITPQILKAAENLKQGDYVQVSGLRLSNGEIVASRVASAQAASRPSVVGQVTQVDANGFTLNGLRVSHSGIARPGDLAKGAEVLVSGEWDGSKLNAAQIRVEPTLRFRGKLDGLLLEGFVHSRLENRQFKLGNATVTLSANTRFSGGVAAGLERDQHVQVYVRPTADNRLVAERIEFRRGGASRSDSLLPLHGGKSKNGDSDKGDHSGPSGGANDRSGSSDRSGPSDGPIDHSGSAGGNDDRSGPSDLRNDRSGPSDERIDRSGSSDSRGGRSDGGGHGRH